MDLEALPFDAPLSHYEKQAAELSQVEIGRRYGFEDWPVLAGYVTQASDRGSAVFRFESAVEAVVNGHIEALPSLIDQDSKLPNSRSVRTHRATLLHYTAANGVEQHRQKSPQNAPAIAHLLLERGADVNALAEMYGGRPTTLIMLVSSSPPADAGVQVPLVETLLDFGADIEAGSPLLTALAFGHLDAAQVLARRGANADNLAAAAGLGRLADAQRFLGAAGSQVRHQAFALAAQHGHLEIVRLLLDAGEDPNRYNPAGNHAHSTPLHQAVWAGHDAVVRLLVERGARLDIRDTVYQGTPLDWAVYGRREELRDYLAGLKPPAA